MNQVSCPVCKNEMTSKETIGYWCLTCKKSLDRIEEELLDFIKVHHVCKLCGVAPEYLFQENGTFDAPRVEVKSIYCKNCEYQL